MNAAEPLYEAGMRAYRVALLLPTYNNATRIGEVLEHVFTFTSSVIVVNDGSTDNTAEVLEQYPLLQLVSYEKNRGKGWALRQGFKFAVSQGYDYVITMDTDGQHDAADIQVFLNELDRQPGALMIGARNMDQASVPGKSSFGNKFSNFWFKVETGIKLPDTQSGYRLYPLEPLRKMKFFTVKYEFEIEVIVRAAWKGVPVIAVPVKVYYPPAEERISHFRPFKDFSRISVLNTVLVLITFLWIKPRDFFITPFRKKGWKAVLRDNFMNPNETNAHKAASIGFGVFMGIVPIWGFQLAVGIPLAILMRLNKALFLVAANISIFPPIIWAASLLTGKLVLGKKDWAFQYDGLTIETMKRLGAEFFVGGAVLSVVAGAFAYLLTLVLLKTFRKSSPKA